MGNGNRRLPSANVPLRSEEQQKVEQHPETQYVEAQPDTSADETLPSQQDAPTRKQ